MAASDSETNRSGSNSVGLELELGISLGAEDWLGWIVGWVEMDGEKLEVGPELGTVVAVGSVLALGSMLGCLDGPLLGWSDGTALTLGWIEGTALTLA